MATRPDTRCLDLAGQRFGRLDVLEFVRLERWSRTIWKCRCDCGVVEERPARAIRKCLECRACSQVRSQSDAIKHDAFAQQSTASDFWAGVIASDGCVRGRSVVLGFKATDESFLAEWKQWIGSEHKIDRRTKVVGKRSYKSVYLTITSRQIVADLASRYNITPRKSLTLEPPTNCTMAFLAGLWCGDGTIGRYSSERRGRLVYNWSIGWCGTPEMMAAVAGAFSDVSNATPSSHKGKPHFSSIKYHGPGVTADVAARLIGCMPFRLDRKQRRLDAMMSEYAQASMAGRDHCDI